MWDESEPKWTYIFIATSLAFYILQMISHIEVYLAYIPAYTIQHPWTPISAIFLHINLNHLIYNMLALLIFGTILEKRIGNQPFFALFITSGIIGNLGYLVTTTNPMIPVIGASGAIYGVMGTLAVLEPYRLVYLYGLMPLPMAAAAILWALGDIMGLFQSSNIAHGAHLVGMLVRIITGLQLRNRQRNSIIY